LDIFTQRVNRDEKILSFAEGRQVTVRYELTDIKMSFYTAFDQGTVRCGMGDPPAKPQVILKMKADILDKLFTGKENGPKAAMTGKLSFIGDTIKAMSLQRIQKDFNRLYIEARAEVKNLDAVFERGADAEPPQHNASAGALTMPASSGAAPDRIVASDIRAEVIRAVRDYFDSHGFLLMDTPIFTPAACEGTTNLFEVNYFDDAKAYLTQSGQLYNEATAAAFGKVYCFGPTFRAEKSKTRRHLTEFWMVEPEVAYADLDDVMNIAEDFITFIVHRVLENRRKELGELERDISKLEKVAVPFPRLQYDDAVRMLKEGHEKGETETPFEWGGDFGAPDETYLSNQFDRPVMVHRYPRAVKAFYMKADPERADLALCVDVLAPEGYGEIIGGGQRAEDLDYLLKQIQEHNLPEEAFDWYLDLRRYGTFPHGGFGMGIERCTAWLCGIEHLREAIPFPRMLYRLKP